MKYIKFLIFVLTLSSLTKTQAQCDVIETITVCDMTTVDGNNDGTPDGVINLYDAYNALPGVTPISIATGTWFDPNFNFALDNTTGDLYLWDLTNTSTTSTDYQFVINSTSCASGIAITLNLILGPFSGDALPVINADDVNLQICDIGSTPTDLCAQLVDIDLFQALESIPSPHLNGQWTYNGSSPNFVSLTGSNLIVTIPYQPGPPLVDEETFEFTYTVSGISPCNVPASVATTVNVSVVRQVFSGYSKNRRICEDEILSGNYDTDLDLRDDQFLALEDIEGIWEFDGFGQITSPVDSSVNIKDIYDQIIIRDGVRFGCAEVNFTYSVDQRSGVCGDASSTVSFKIYEDLRPFSQHSDPFEYCEDAAALPASVNLYDQLEFTTENGVLFDYDRNIWTNWHFISGPSVLGLVTSTDPSTVEAGYSSLGTVSLLNAPPGDYVFEYVVYPQYNCDPDSFEVLSYSPDYCAALLDPLLPCQEERAQVRLTIHPKLYAGEDTTGLQFCETDPTIASPLDLFTLLTTNGVDDPIYQGPLGTWIDLSTGSTVANPVTLPNVNGQQIFNYRYTTTTSNNCVDTANLSFTVFEEYQSGTGSSIDVCDNNAPFDLFDNLTGNPNANGTWSGPNGYTSATHNAIITPGISDAGDYIYTVPDNVDALGVVQCFGNSATMTVVNYQSPSAGTGGSYLVCRSDLQIDLVDYLDASADTGGDFRDLDTGNVLPDSLLDVSQLTEGTYDFQYEIQGHASCYLETSQISIMVVEVTSPTATDQVFCVSIGATVLDLVASNGSSFNWYDTVDDTSPLSIGTVLINGEDYFVAAVDADGCESPRIGITVTLLPLNHIDCDGCFKDGVSVNGDNENDVFDLCDLPVAFPNFEINIYNRYGSKVYKGNQSTPLFNGISNVPLTIGKELPSGVYFFVFDPKDGDTAPIQGNFYLSR